jgi:long-chain acyl-CoA synthetase
MVADGDDWRAVTWHAHATQIKHIALFLQGLGIELGDRAAVFAHNSVAWMSAALGIQSAGGVMVPIYPASTASQAAYIADHSDTRALFVGDAELLARVFERWSAYHAVMRIVLLDDGVDHASVLREVKRTHPDAPSIGDVEDRIVTWSRALALGAAHDHESPERFSALLASVTLEAAAVMLYTSGTTGDPKGVPLTHANISINGRDWLESNASLLEEGAIDLLWLPMSHIFGFGEACAGNLLGYTTYLSDPKQVLAHLPSVRPSVFMSVPAYWEKLARMALAETDRDAQRHRIHTLTGGRLRFCLSGGAGLKREVKELFYNAGVLLIEGYGLTECSPTLTLNRPNAFRFDAVGKPLPSVELKLADDGEILAKGPSVFAGYHKNEDATREAFTDDGWFKTGDVGRFTDDGFLQIIDRKKEILVTAGGKNIPPANIEQRFADDPIFLQVLVYGDAKPYLTAGVWLNPEAIDAKLAESDLSRAAAINQLVAQSIDKVNSELARYETIKRWRIMDTPLTVARGLLTSTLKVRRKKVYEAFRAEFEELYA